MRLIAAILCILFHHPIWAITFIHSLEAGVQLMGKTVAFTMRILEDPDKLIAQFKSREGA